MFYFLMYVANVLMVGNVCAPFKAIVSEPIEKNRMKS